VHVIVNGRFAIRDGKATGTLAGEPLLRGGLVYRPAPRTDSTHQNIGGGAATRSDR